MRRYKVTWNGPWDGDRGPRALTMRATSKAAALKAHLMLFPCRRVEVAYLGKAIELKRPGRTS